MEFSIPQPPAPKNKASVSSTPSPRKDKSSASKSHLPPALPRCSNVWYITFISHQNYLNVGMVCLVNQTPYQPPPVTYPTPDIFGAYQPYWFPLKAGPLPRPAPAQATLPSGAAKSTLREFETSRGTLQCAVPIARCGHPTLSKSQVRIEV